MPIYYNSRLKDVPDYSWSENTGRIISPGEKHIIHYTNLAETKRRLIACRIERGWSVYDWAKIMNYNIDMAKRIESDGMMSMHHLEAVAKLYWKDVSYFLAEDEQYEQLQLF